MRAGQTEVVVYFGMMQGAGGNFKAAGVGCGWGPAWEGLSEYSCAVPDVCGDQMG